MPVDPEYLRQHYASLSDDGLLEINRGDLVETAQRCYDQELERRGLSSRRSSGRPGGSTAVPTPLQVPSEESEFYDTPQDALAKPEWLDEASEVFSQADLPGSTPSPNIAIARDVLEAADIPCYLDLSDMPEEKSVSTQPKRLWRLMVPGELNLRATSVLERDIFNADFEQEWKTHLEMLSDDELGEMNPRSVFCGLFDRVERVTRCYEEELTRRNRLKFGSA